MEAIMKNSTLDWVKYSDYEYRLDEDGEVYICPTADSQASIINPAQMQTDLVLDALNIGRFASEEKADNDYPHLPTRQMGTVRSMILGFCRKYGLLGFMVSFPLSLDFLEKKDVLLGSNPLTEKDTMMTREYIKLFTPFQKDMTVTSNMVANTNTLPFTMFMEKPLVYGIVFAKSYAEKLDWVLGYFKELYLHFGACFYVDKTDNSTLKTVYSSRVGGFKLYNLGFQMKMVDKPMAVWDFVSLKILMDTAYAFLVSDDAAPLRICKHCGNVFTASHVKTEFCSPQCRNQYNVYKSRGK